MSEKEKIRLKDLPVRTKIVNKHKKVSSALWAVTFVIFFPFAVLQIINEILEKIMNKAIVLRNKLTYLMFKVIYRKEIIANEKQLEKMLKGENDE